MLLLCQLAFYLVKYIAFFCIKKQHCYPLLALVKQRNILHISARTEGKTVLVPVFPN